MKEDQDEDNLVCLKNEVIMKIIKYRHLTLDQRSHIEELVSSGFSLRQIGQMLEISASTVCRELKRNSDKGYNYIQAQIISIARRHAASSDFKKLKGKVEERILEYLQKTWRPEQILLHPIILFLY